MVAREAGLQGTSSISATTDESKHFVVLMKLVNVPGVVNGGDVQAHIDLSFEITQDFVVSGSREDDGSVFTGGQTNRIDLEVKANEAVEIRDVVPEEWGVDTEHGDVQAVSHDADRGVKYVTFRPRVSKSLSATYFAEAPLGLELSNQYSFGPVQARSDAADEWYDVRGTSDSNVVVGQST